MVALVCAALTAALLLGIWGDLARSSRRLAWVAARAAAAVGGLATVWAVLMAKFGQIGTIWAAVLVLGSAFGSAVAVVAVKVFALVIVRILILPACLPAKVFQFLSGCPEDHLDKLRARMTGSGDRYHPPRGWVPLAVSTGGVDDLSIDAMVWRGTPGSSQQRKGKEKWVIFFNGNGARYEECAEEMEEYGAETGLSVAAFNYRGVGRSAGVPCKALLLSSCLFSSDMLGGGRELQRPCRRWRGIVGGTTRDIWGEL